MSVMLSSYAPSNTGGEIGSAHCATDGAVLVEHCCEGSASQVDTFFPLLLYFFVACLRIAVDLSCSGRLCSCDSPAEIMLATIGFSA
jgi:hypothetical protein